jgi:hypothetical protein
MDLFAPDGVNKGAFSHHVIAPHHPSTNQKHRTISRLRKEECECWNHCQVHDDGTMERSLERWNAAGMVQYNAYNAANFRKCSNIVFLFCLFFFFFFFL